MKKILTFLLMACFVSSYVAALGIAPARKEVVSPENITYRVYNTEAKDFTATIKLNGTMKEYITLDKSSITFTKEEKFKTFTINIDAKGKNNLFSDLIVSDGTTEVIAKLTLGEVPNKITGNLIKEEHQSDSNILITGLLIMIVMANIGYFIAGRVKKKMNPEKLLAKLIRMSDSSFRTKVTKEQNKIADEIKDIEPDLAYKLYDLTNRQAMISTIQDYLMPKSVKGERAL